MSVQEIFTQLGIEATNYGSCYGTNDWSHTKDAGELISLNPSTGEVLAKVFQCNEENYNTVVEKFY